MKQYMLSVWHDGVTEAPPAEDMEHTFKAVDAFNSEIIASGNWVFGGGLFPADTATVVRVTDGDVLMTDGPFAESKEYLGGFWIVNAADLDEALSLAERGARACGGPVEVRPFHDEPES